VIGQKRGKAKIGATRPRPRTKADDDFKMAKMSILVAKNAAFACRRSSWPSNWNQCLPLILIWWPRTISWRKNWCSRPRTTASDSEKANDPAIWEWRSFTPRVKSLESLQFPGRKICQFLVFCLFLKCEKYEDSIVETFLYSISIIYSLVNVHNLLPF
jgi:hypothetical protein